MDSFRDTAIGLSIWYAFLAFLGGLLLIVLNDLAAPAALLAAANIALLFALGLIAKARALNDHSICRGQFWRALPPRQRPSAEPALRVARTALEQTFLRFAKGAAALAIVLCVLAAASHGDSGAALADARHTSTHIVD
jgi:hypothetical protein